MGSPSTKAALKPLSGLDAAFLYLEASGSPMHVGSLMLLEVPARRQAKFHALLTEHVRQRLPHAPVLRRLLQPAPLGIGHPLWSELPEIDLKRHVRRRRLAGAGGKARLDSLVGRLHAEALPRELPLWQFVVVENVEPGVLALYAKIHHSLLDGQGGIALAQALLDLAPVAPRKRDGAVAKPAPVARTRSRDLARSATAATVRQFAHLLRALPPT
jgi:hypothetical protein